MRFEFATATRIVFGEGALGEVGPLAAEMGRRALVLSGKDAGRAAGLLGQLRDNSIECSSFCVAGEPTTTIVADAVERARSDGCDMVIGFGGGSVVDAGKAVAAMLTNSGELLDYLEVVGRGKAISVAPAPCIAIPTTAGTGAEVTRNAVLASPEHRVKVSMRNPMLLPRLAVVDPVLTYSMPPAVTASTGLDALTQLIEAYVCNEANPLTDGICREGLGRAARSLRQAYADGSDAGAREDMAVASLFGGLALANAKLGAVHGFAGVIGGGFTAAHGAVCGALLGHVMRVNVSALEQRDEGNRALRRYEEIARIMTGSPVAGAADAVEWVRDVCRTLEVPGLGEFGVRPADVDDLVERASKASSMKGNPVLLTREELVEILSGAIEG